MNKKFAPILLILVLAALAVGVTYWRGQNQTVVPAEQPVVDAQNQATQPPPTLDTAPVSTADWKTYRNEQYGFELKYPGTMPLDFSNKYSDRIYLFNVKIGDITVKILSKSNLPSCPDKTLVGQVKCLYLILDLNANRISQQKFGDNYFVYADFEAIDHPNVRSRNIWAFTEKGGYIYQFEVIDPNVQRELSMEDMLSTFKFLDTAPVSTADWKTYKNDEYNYEFKYPKGENLGYLRLEGGNLVGFLSDKEAQNWASNLLIGTEKSGPILFIRARKNKIDQQINLNNAMVEERSIFKAPVEVINNNYRFNKYGTVSGQIYNGFQILYSSENNGIYYVLDLDDSELAKRIFSTFKFVQ